MTGRPSTEERLAMMEALVAAQANILLRQAARVTALELLLGEHKALDREALARRVDTILADVDETVELSPRHAAFRQWRRELRAGGPAPDDMT